VRAISTEDAVNGTFLYQKDEFTADGGRSYSLEGIFNNPSSDDADLYQYSRRYVDASNNPVYGTYMHSLWMSPHGSGRDAIEPRDQYQFLGASIDNYGATIIENMLEKPSGYNARLTSESIRVIGVWMAFVQSLYDAVSSCALDVNADGGVTLTTTDIDDPGYVSPVDVAAAFWYGSRQTWYEDDDDGSMYGWAKIAKSNFDGTTFDANDSIGRGLNRLQPLLPQCLVNRNTGMNEEVENAARAMRAIVDDIVRYATVPMVQNLIHHSARIALGVVDTAVSMNATTDTGATVPMEEGVTTVVVGGGGDDATSMLDDAVDWIIVSLVIITFSFSLGVG
jgi:hypothetical protein